MLTYADCGPVRVMTMEGLADVGPHTSVIDIWRTDPEEGHILGPGMAICLDCGSTWPEAGEYADTCVPMEPAE